MDQRRPNDFIEKLSLILVGGAFIGGFIVLLDIKFITSWFQLGGAGFAPEIKGVVLQSMLISGFAAVVGFWLSATKQGQDQAISVNKIAEASVPVASVVPAIPSVTELVVPNKPIEVKVS